MRVALVVACVLLAGCSASSEPVEAPTDAPPVDAAPTPSAPAVAADPYIVANVLVEETVELAGSVATGLDASPWVTGIRPAFTVPSSAGFSGLYLEIEWSAASGAAAGGTAGYWAQDLPPQGVEPETFGVASATHGETGFLWVPAQDLAAMEEPAFTVAAAGGPDHALYGTARVAVTAFFGGDPPADYTAL